MKLRKTEFQPTTLGSETTETGPPSRSTSIMPQRQDRPCGFSPGQIYQKHGLYLRTHVIQARSFVALNAGEISTPLAQSHGKRLHHTLWRPTQSTSTLAIHYGTDIPSFAPRGDYAAATLGLTDGSDGLTLLHQLVANFSSMNHYLWFFGLANVQIEFEQGKHEAI
jgi:hypothetical protein